MDALTTQASVTAMCQFILGQLSNLCNSVTQKQALATLRQLRSDYKPLFCSTTLLHESVKFMSAYNLKLAARRFVLFDLFNSTPFTAASLAAFEASRDRLLEADQLGAAVARDIGLRVK